MRREEREDAEKDLKLALQKVQAEAQEEIKRQSDVYLRQQKEQQEVINKLQVIFLWPIFGRGITSYTVNNVSNST